MTDEEIEEVRERYIDALKTLLLPGDPLTHDIVNYFSSLLRVFGLEDQGWDPFVESRATLEDLNALLQIDLPEDRFPDSQLTLWRIGLLMYAHIVEMDAPYEVLTNLLRFQLGKGYSPDPYFDFLDTGQRKRRLGPRDKIAIIKDLSQELGNPVGEIFDEFYSSELRNAIGHSDYILLEDEFRSRGGISGLKPFSIPLTDLNFMLTKAKIFLSSFFGLETSARRAWGSHKHRGIPYDPHYKGLMEVLVTDDDLLCGFKVHWPNGSESMYRRTPEGVDMVNCMVQPSAGTIELFVGMYARQPGTFSPLVEVDQMPMYTALESGELPVWDQEAASAPRPKDLWKGV